jgi:CDP-6-deoxy-D-xylo-4-hexulose-3-dehydrase
MSTIEGGMICTNDEYFYQVCRSLRSHGMVREMTDENLKNKIINDNPTLNKDFIFLRPSHNFRSTEINAVLGISQLKKLDNNNQIRKNNFDRFISKLDSNKYITDLSTEGQCNYAFIVIMKEKSFELRDLIEKTLNENGIEFRRGLSGGGNQLRQPFLIKQYENELSNFQNVEHVHNFSWYIGNYPSLETEKIDFLVSLLNKIS